MSVHTNLNISSLKNNGCLRIKFIYSKCLPSVPWTGIYSCWLINVKDIHLKCVKLRFWNKFMPTSFDLPEIAYEL